MKLFTLYSCFSLLLVVNTCRLWAEGTKEVMPDSTNGTGLIVSTTASFPLGNVGAYLGAPADDRIYFRINDFTTENLYYGFNWETLAPSGSIVPYSDVYMNIFFPSGALAATVHLTGTGAGFISNYATAVAGPNIAGLNPSGYNPLSFVPTANGDWFVTFYRSTDGGVTHLAGGESMLSKYFDLTVAKTNNTKFPGRVHCTEWAFSVYNPAKGDIQDPLSPTNAQFFAYTTDSVVSRIYFPKKGFQPLSYIVAVNSFGVQNTGNWLNDRKSINLPHLVSPYLTGGYPVFLNVPDPALYAVCTIPNPPTLVSPTISGCPPGPYNIRFFAPQAGDYYVLLDLNGVPGYQPSSADRFIELIGQVPGVITYVWDGKNGLGVSVPSNTTFPITFSFRKGRINLPFYDVELNINGFSVDAVSPMNSLLTTLYWDDSQLTSMGTDCSSNNNNYTGIGYTNAILGQASPGHAWNGDGNSGFLVPAPSVTYTGIRNDSDNVQCNDFGNARLINTWAWGITLNTTQTLTLMCLTVSGTVWDDADGSANGTFSNIKTNSEAGTNAGNTLFASLIDPVTNNVISTVAVNTNGTYTLPNCPVNATGMKVVISTTAGVVGSPAPPATIPAAINWTNTSPLTYTFNTATTNVTGLDFGVEQLPNSVDQNYTIAMPPVNSIRPLNGFGTIASPGPLAGSDPEDGTLGSTKTVVITQVPTNEQLFYNGVLVTNNTTITNYTPVLLGVKFINVGVPSTSFQYAFVDAAGRQDPTPATYTINMSVVLQTTLTAFAGKEVDNGVGLNWTATNVTSGLYFTVERSADGSNFTAIGRVDGVNTGGNADLAFTDNNPLPDATGYYRLKMTDVSGAVSYSNIIAISLGSGNSAVEVSPNPFRGIISIKLNLQSSGRVSLRLLDSKGMLVKQAEYSAVIGVNIFQVNGLSTLPVSVYFVQVVMPDKVYVKKVYNQK
ncbi:MAG: hypothetical protein Q8927_02585 [Bacteroidota bacterium]|nr:hypothetical protein [Bacteroidota bacterium]MDP4215059.1 hypothetical protein [Bacteroidota bacterium]MDP4244290.1 hypothetical protein [Bacteroidota bacterium]MDP4252780.1 hypothetical protein [Bacteroidota bacterium]MDP4257535.1 hypothetical protein [Bacteroidota bacterium]